MCDLSKWLKWTKDCKYLPEQELKKLVDILAEILIEEPNVHSISSPVAVCGDIHGQFYDLKQLFRTVGPVSATKYIFMGDYVDRGYYSVETMTYLFLLKLKYPGQFTLLRGNHESRSITKTYGFYDECFSKYGNHNVWKNFCRVFDLLPIAAIVDEEILCVHGGISPHISTIDDVRTINRNCDIPNKGPFADLVWSDPEEGIDGWMTSPRGSGWLFGGHVVKEFLHLNSLNLISRAHQLVQEGVRYMFNGRLVTVWSAPNYCYRCGNVASVLICEAPNKRVSRIFRALPDNERKKPKTVTSMPYFV